MGSNLAMLFAENGFNVSAFDAKPQNIDNLKSLLSDPQSGLAPDLHSRVDLHKEYGSFMQSLSDGPKLLLLSIPHGSPADSILKEIDNYLKEGDIILDGGNEWYQNAERRQQQLQPRGISYLSMGVSGGYQSARRGPSISPSGDQKALGDVFPILEKIAAKDRNTGQPCVAMIGPKGSGHYVKMVHNDIEQGILGVMNEAWELMSVCLGMSLDDISKVFRAWAQEGELVR